MIQRQLRHTRCGCSFTRKDTYWDQCDKHGVLRQRLERTDIPWRMEA